MLLFGVTLGQMVAALLGLPKFGSVWFFKDFSEPRTKLRFRFERGSVQVQKRSKLRTKLIFIVMRWCVTTKNDTTLIIKKEMVKIKTQKHKSLIEKIYLQKEMHGTMYG